MATARPLRDIFTELTGDADARGADPAELLRANGHADLPDSLVAEAVVTYADTAPIEVAEQLAPYVTAHTSVPGHTDEIEASTWLETLATTPDTASGNDPTNGLDPTDSLDPTDGLDELAAATGAWVDPPVESGEGVDQPPDLRDLDFGLGVDSGPDPADLDADSDADSDADNDPEPIPADAPPFDRPEFVIDEAGSTDPAMTDDESMADDATGDPFDAVP